MKTIKGIICEISEGLETDSVTVVTGGKFKSKIKLPAGSADDFTIGNNCVITVDDDPTLFNRDGEVSAEVVNAVRAMGDDLPEGNSMTITTRGKSATIQGKKKAK